MSGDVVTRGMRIKKHFSVKYSFVNTVAYVQVSIHDYVNVRGRGCGNLEVIMLRCILRIIALCSCVKWHPVSFCNNC